MRKLAAHRDFAGHAGSRGMMISAFGQDSTRMNDNVTYIKEEKRGLVEKERRAGEYFGQRRKNPWLRKVHRNFTNNLAL